MGKEGGGGGGGHLPVAGDELTAALIAVEAFQVKHRVAGPHHQLVRGYLVAATPANAAVAEQPATRSKKCPIKTRFKVAESRYSRETRSRDRLRRISDYGIDIFQQFHPRFWHAARVSIAAHRAAMRRDVLISRVNGS